MMVWIPVTPDRAQPVPEPTIASKARALKLTDAPSGWPGFNSAALYQAGSPEMPGIPVWGVNDQWEPSGSSDIGKPYYCWFGNRGQDENVAYLFDKVEKVSEVAVYWLEFEHYDVDYKVPQSWELYYLSEDGKWTEVDKTGDYGVNKDCYNTVKFTPVETRGLQIVARPQKGASGGIIEWKVN